MPKLPGTAIGSLIGGQAWSLSRAAGQPPGTSVAYGDVILGLICVVTLN